MTFSDQFAGKRIVVTGGADGISKAASALMAARGADRIVIGDLNVDLATVTAADITEATGATVTAHNLDVSDPASVTAFAAAALADLEGTVDVLVNGAGVLRLGSIAETTPEKWDFTVNINLRGTFLVTRAFWPALTEAPSASIVNVASLAARIGGIASGVDYTASKGGVY